MNNQNKDNDLEKIKAQLKKVVDPELNIDILDLGLLRDIELGDWDDNFSMYEYIKIIMTLTSPMCPFVDSIIQDVEDKVNELQIGECQVDITFDPPWEVPEHLRLELGL